MRPVAKVMQLSRMHHLRFLKSFPDGEKANCRRIVRCRAGLVTRSGCGLFGRSARPSCRRLRCASRTAPSRRCLPKRTPSSSISGRNPTGPPERRYLLRRAGSSNLERSRPSSRPRTAGAQSGRRLPRLGILAAAPQKRQSSFPRIRSPSGSAPQRTTLHWAAKSMPTSLPLPRFGAGFRIPESWSRK